MSKQEKEVTKNGSANGANGNGAHDDGDEGGWVEIKTDRPVYSAERGQGKPVRGYLLGAIFGMKSNQPGQRGDGPKTWDALIVRLTAAVECTIREGQQKKKLQVAAGEEILVPVNHKLRHLMPIITDPSHTRFLYQIAIAPCGIIPTPNGNTNDYKMKVAANPRLRSAADKLLLARPPVPQLDGGAAREEEIPF